MDLYEYLVILKRSFWLPLILIVILGFWAWNDVRNTPYNYTGSVTFIVGNSSLTNLENTNYGQYYNLAASGNFADTLSNLLSSPSVIIDIYSQAHVELPTQDVATLSHLIKAAKSSSDSSVVVANITADSSNEASALSQSMTRVVETQIKKLQTDSALPKEINISASKEVVLSFKRNPVFNVSMAILAGLFFGSALVFLGNSIKRSR